MISLLTGDFDKSFIDFMEEWFEDPAPSRLTIQYNEYTESMNIESSGGGTLWWINENRFTNFSEFLQVLERFEGLAFDCIQTEDGTIIF